MATGFLYGNRATVNPDDIDRISSNVPQLYNTTNWRPLELGAFTEDSCPQTPTGSTLLHSLTPLAPAVPNWSSQTGYVLADCVRGADEFCQTDLMYKQCNPYSRHTPATDPTCFPAAKQGHHVPW